MFLEYFNNDGNIKSLISANAVLGWVRTPEYEFEDAIGLYCITRRKSPAYASFIFK